MRVFAPLVVVVATLVAGVVGVAAAAPHVVDDGELRVLNHVNRQRAAAGLPALRRDEGLRALARYHSADMAFARFVSAISPADGALAERAVEQAGVSGAAEVATHVATCGGDVVAASAALLDPALTRVGIGVVEDGGRLYVTQVAVADPPAEPEYASARAHAPSSPIAAIFARIQQAFDRWHPVLALR